jgi:hypothetical protein
MVPSLTQTPTDTNTPTLTLTPTITPLFSDDFLAPDPDHWDLSNTQMWGPRVTETTGSEKLNITIDCKPYNDPSINANAPCDPIIRLIKPTIKNFIMTFDLIFEKLTLKTSVWFYVRFRENGNYYYSFSTDYFGNYYFDLYLPDQRPLVSEPNTEPIIPEVGKPITFRVFANDNILNISENGNPPFAQGKDGNIYIPGTISFVFSVNQGGAATISIKNFNLYALP